MVKIIGLFAIVFVYYCEINAEVDNLRNSKPTGDVRRMYSAKKKFVGNRSSGIWLRSNAGQQSSAKFATGFREDIKHPLKEYVPSHGEARNNDLEHHEANKRRFKRNDMQDEIKHVNEHDNVSKTPKMKKIQLHHSGRKMIRHRKSTKNKKAKRHKKDNEDRYLRKDKKRHKEKKHSGKRKRDRNLSKYSKHSNASHKKEKDYLKKKKRDRSKHKQREKSMDNKKHPTIGSKEISRSGLISLVTENYNEHDVNQELNKNTGRMSEKSKHAIDKSKAAIGIGGVGAAGFAGLVGKALASIKETKKPEPVTTTTTTQEPTTVTVSTSTTTPKPSRTPVSTSTTTSKGPPEPVQERRVREKKLVKRDRLGLRTDEKTRITRMIPLSMNKQEEDDKQKLRQKPDGGSGTPPSNLSPYAIAVQMELLMKEFPSVNATVTKPGRTVEYNDLVLVSITAKTDDETYFRVKESKYIDEVPEKKIIFIVHGLTVMGLKDMTSLVKNSELKLLLSYYFKHLDKFDFFLMPLANPDGYSASLSSDRTIWNKNVSPQSVCPGVFVDRNFDVAWNNTKQISSCSQLYPGAMPFSEEESKAVREVFHHYSHKILAYIHVHAGTFDERVFKGDAILYPRGYTKTQSDDDKYIDIKGEVDEAMKNASFRVITATVDTLANWYGVVSGTSVDYAATVYGIPYAMEFVMQLYDTESLNNNALTEIWSRLIDATFNSMWKSLKGGSDARRFR